MDGRIPWSALASVLLALGCAQAFAGNPVQGHFRVGVRVLPSPSVSASLLDAVPAPIGAIRLSRSATGDSYWIAHDAGTATTLYRDTMRARGYRLAWQSDDGRMSTWRNDHHRVEIEVRDVLGSTPAARVIVQATPSS